MLEKDEFASFCKNEELLPTVAEFSVEFVATFPEVSAVFGNVFPEPLKEFSMTVGCVF
jgi:hypothetical protein